MNAFQLLKSGTSFKKQRIEKVEKLFNPKKQVEQSQKVDQAQNEDLSKIDAAIETCRLETIETKNKQKLTELAEKYKALVAQRNEALNRIRKKYKITVEGEGVPDLICSFQEMSKKYNFGPHFMQSVKQANYKNPTPVQMQAIPVLMEKRSSIVLAETGSGKSLAFIVPLLELIKKGDGLKAVVIAPTRELTIQLYKEFLVFQENHLKSSPRVKFLRKALFPKNEEMLKRLVGNTEILIATPLKLAQLVENFPNKIDMVQFFVVDEADKMFEMGFLDQVDAFLSAVPNNASICKFMFSATMQPQIQDLVKGVMNDPVKLQIGIKNATASTVKQDIVYVGREDAKLMTLRQTLKDGFEPPMLIFVQSKHRAKELYHELIFDGLNVNMIHGDKKKEERDEIMRQFRLGEIWILICTDLMSRGIDFKTVNSVINFDFPTSLVSYIHRVGRTGRAGRQGVATTYFTEDDAPFVKTIANLMKKSGQDVPEWMLKLKGANNKDWKKIEKKPIHRKTISTSIERNTNKRFMKNVRKDAKRLAKLSGKGGDAEPKDQGEDDFEIGSEGGNSEMFRESDKE